MGRIMHFNDLERSFVPFALIKVMVLRHAENNEGYLEYIGTTFFDYRNHYESFDNTYLKYINDEVRYIWVENGLLNVCLYHYE